MSDSVKNILYSIKKSIKLCNKLSLLSIYIKAFNINTNLIYHNYCKSP